MFVLRALGDEDVPAAVRPTVRLAGGGAAAQTETKGGATAHTGHAAGTGGNTNTHTQRHTQCLLFILRNFFGLSNH